MNKHAEPLPLVKENGFIIHINYCRPYKSIVNEKINHYFCIMIKKSGVLFLALLYTVTALGFALNFHYCFNQLYSVKIDSPASCVKGGETSKMKCCKNKHIEVKVKDAHQSGSSSFLSKLFVFDLPKLPLGDFFFSAQKLLLEKLFDRGPPLRHPDGITLFLKNCIFRI